MIRTLHPELLDELPPHDSGAIQSRRDLRRLNSCMGHDGILARQLQHIAPQKDLRLIEIGAGDGELLLHIAGRLQGNWPKVDATLVDMQQLLRKETQDEFALIGWRVVAVRANVFDWLASSGKSDVILANLFLHHFSTEQLQPLFATIANETDTLIALEPRRAHWPLFWARWLRLIGCGPVTCHDAPVSVRAGFRDRELSALWPKEEGWSLTESRAGLFSHLFVARKR